MGEGGVGFAAEHAGDFFDAGLVRHFHEIGDGAVGGEAFADDVLRGGGGGDLREVRDAEHLMAFAKGTHFRGDGVGDFAADVGVDFIEHEQRNSVLRGERGFDGEHDAGDFAAGGDGFERLRGFARIRREEELDALEAAGERRGEGMQHDLEAGFLKAEFVQLRLDVFRQLRRGFFAGSSELFAEGVHFLLRGFDFAGEAF